MLVTRTQEVSEDAQLERFYEQGDEGDYFMQREVEVAAADVGAEARRILADRIASEHGDKTLAAKYQAMVEAGDFRDIVQEWRGGEWDDDGNLYYLMNPDATWDWYVVGGRWTGGLVLKPAAEGELGSPGLHTEPAEPGTADVALVKDIDWDKTKPTFAILHNDEWIEQGSMGWFGVVTDQQPQDEWEAVWRKVVAALDPGDEVTLVDCHI